MIWLLPYLTKLGALRQWLFTHWRASLCVVAFVAVAYHVRFVDPRAKRDAFQAGRLSLQQEAQASIAGYVQAMNAAVAKRDSAIAQTKRASTRLTNATETFSWKRAALPPQPPLVEEVLAAADSVVLAASDFQKAVVTERIVTDTLIQIDTAQVHALSVDNTALRARNQELEKRPTKKKALAWAFFSALFGAATTYGATR